MSTRTFRLLTALAGICGAIALGYYYSVPFPLPPANATLAQVTAFAAQYHTAVFFDTWLQSVGSLLLVVFFVALVYLAHAVGRLAGGLTLVAAALTLAVALAEGTFSIGTLQALADGHPQAALTSFDLTFVFVHIFLIGPAPLTFLALGGVLLGSDVLPRVFGWLALGLGVAFVLVGFAGLFSGLALTISIFLLIGQELWVVAVSITLLVAGKASHVTTTQQPTQSVSQFQ
jgi:hypothetical protein